MKKTATFIQAEYRWIGTILRGTRIAKFFGVALSVLALSAWAVLSIVWPPAIILTALVGGAIYASTKA